MQKITFRRLRPLIILLSAIAWLTACQDPTTIGYDLLDQEQANLGYSDTLKASAVTIPGDSVRTYSPTLLAQLNSYLFGRMQDPLFGAAESSVYVQVRPERPNPGFAGAVLDSVVLVLPYDTFGLYGRLEETFGIEVLRVTEPMDRTQDHFSGASFAVDFTPLGVLQFTPNLDSLEVVEYLSPTVRDTISFPHLRIPLDPAFGLELLQLDTNLLKSDSSFLSYLPGIHLRPTRATAGMLSFDLRNQPYRGGIYLYYTQDTIRRQFQFEIDEFSTRLTRFEHDYAGSPVGSFIGDAEAGDSLLFVQGMGGLNVEITLPDLSEYKDVIVNKAELLVTLRDDLSADPYDPPGQLALFLREPDNDLVPVADLVLAAAQGRLATVFGGSLNSKDKTYSMNISSYFQEAIEGAESNRLVLTLAPDAEALGRFVFYGAGASAKAETAARAALYGPGDPVKGLKIRLAFTKL